MRVGWDRLERQQGGGRLSLTLKESRQSQDSERLTGAQCEGAGSDSHSLSKHLTPHGRHYNPC